MVTIYKSPGAAGLEKRLNGNGEFICINGPYVLLWGWGHGAFQCQWLWQPQVLVTLRQISVLLGKGKHQNEVFWSDVLLWKPELFLSSLRGRIVLEVRNEWGGTGGKETKPGFLISGEYTGIFAVQRDQWGSHREPWGGLQQHPLPQEGSGVSWVALCHLGPYFCMNLVNLSRAQPPQRTWGFGSHLCSSPPVSGSPAVFIPPRPVFPASCVAYFNALSSFWCTLPVSRKQ